MSKEKRRTPKVFMSYSWSSESHQKWVMELAERLMGDGVKVILDEWELKEGHDTFKYMEQMVTDKTITKVLAVCDSRYAEKADKREGGVGTESYIISKEVYEKADQEKFIPIVAEFDSSGNPCVPTFFKGRKYINMSSPEETLRNYDRLLRVIYDRPQNRKPTLGTPPAHLFEDAVPRSKTAYKLEMLKRAVSEDKSNYSGLLRDYLKSYSNALADFRIDPDKLNTSVEEKVLSIIEQFLPYRDEFIDFITFIALYKEDSRTYQEIFEFFQNLLKYKNKPPLFGGFLDAWLDQYRFILHELFLYLVTALIEYQRFEPLDIFLSRTYFDRDMAAIGSKSSFSYDVFDLVALSLEEGKRRRQGVSGSIAADLLRKRAYHPELTFDQLMQADFILYLRRALHPLSLGGYEWYPRTLGHAQYTVVFEIFAKATSHIYFQNLMTLLKLQSKEELLEKYQAIEEKGAEGQLELRYASLKTLVNLDNLDTEP